MPYQKKIWCPHPSHSSLTRSGVKPTHPVGRRIIDEREAQLFNTHITTNSKWMSMRIKSGDKVCHTCFNTLPDLMARWLEPEPVLVETPDSENPQIVFDEQLKKDSAKEKLNGVFKLLNMETIRDE